MIDKEELLNSKDFYKSFNNGEELNIFFKQLHKRAVTVAQPLFSDNFIRRSAKINLF